MCICVENGHVIECVHSTCIGCDIIEVVSRLSIVGHELCAFWNQITNISDSKFAAFCSL